MTNYIHKISYMLIQQRSKLKKKKKKIQKEKNNNFAIWNCLRTVTPWHAIAS